MKLESKSNFLFGLLVGAISGFAAAGVYFKKKYQAMLEEEKEDLEEYYGRGYEYYKGEKGTEEQKDAPLEGEEEQPNPEKMDEIKKKLQKNWTRTTDYSSIYKEAKKGLEVNEEEQEMRRRDYESQMDPTEEMIQFTEETKHLPPTELSWEEVQKLPELVEQSEFVYYLVDDTVVCEDEQIDEVISDPENFLGDVLETSGFYDDDRKEIYVMNYELSTLYHVKKRDNAYINYEN